MSQKPSGCRSCLIWMACIIAGFLLIGGVAAYLGYLKLEALRDKYTQTQPLKLPTVRFAASDIDGIHQRIDQFLANARNADTNAHLSLSESEINSLLWSSGYSNMVYVTMTNGSLRGLVSIPIESLPGLFNKVGVNFLKGRYLNGEIALRAGTSEGNLSVTVSELLVNGQPLPEHYMKEVRQTNLAEDLVKDPSTQASIQRIQRIEVENGRLILDVAPKR